ncbi:late competence protein ComER [Paenibacillus sp. J2TS4]|uniref:late competence protein ComER n=1 Tax=Paenibacillus sp. J2TS4 TaxID=2807194 RepID=UPI001B1E6732|nr:late competence protein ComER [Paenibacillus sp. J2TS4]GIP35882.1 ComE operon protein 4 [Paenibacillus sp. J2TS4]
MNTGFIGTGSMGSLLIEAFLHSGALLPQEIVACNRTPSKAEQLAERYRGLRAVRSNKEVVLESELIFLCVKPLEYSKVIDEIKDFVDPSQIIVSITSPVMIQQLEQQLHGQIAKVIPSITNYKLGGALLCMYGSRLQADNREALTSLLAEIGEPIEIEEKLVRVCSDISSCGPAFLAYFLEHFIRAAVEETGIPQQQASALAVQMLVGTGKLLVDGDFTPESLRQRVSVPGGITAEGLQLMEKELNDVFNQLFRITHAKYDEDVAKVASILPPAAD